MPEPDVDNALLVRPSAPGEDVDAEVAALLGPFVGRLEQYRAAQRITEARSGEIPAWLHRRTTALNPGRLSPPDHSGRERPVGAPVRVP